MLTRSLGIRVVWGLCFGGAAVAACGTKDKPAPITGTDTPMGARPPVFGMAGRGGSGGHGGEGGEGGGDAGGAAGTGATTGGTSGSGGDVGAPIVKITSPVAVSDPNLEGVLVGTDLDVICSAKRSSNRGSKPVDESTVGVVMLDADGNPVPADPTTNVFSYAAKATGKADEFSAHVILSKVPDNGPISFVCSASDTSSPPLTGSDTLATFVDHGPIITIEEPAENSPHPLIGALSVAFKVEASPLLPKGDKGAAIADVTLEVGGVSFTDTLVETNGEYATTVNLADTTLFPTPPEGDYPITIHAVDKRRGMPADRIESYAFLVDGEGPAIAITSPVKDAVVGGRVPLAFTVTDTLSGVDEKSVVVELNGVANPFGEGGDWSVSGNNYVFKFDSTQIKDSVAQATVNIRASDLAGNASDGEAWNLYLDNIAPIVDLDPANVRSWKKNGTEYQCSTAFDPLGSAMSDLDQTNSRFAFLRSLVWERTNHAKGQQFLEESGTDQMSVFIYIQPDPSKPFLVNAPNDADPDCDDIDEKALGDLDFIHLSPIIPTGGGWFGTDAPTSFPPVDDFGCTQAMDGAPTHLCLNEVSDLSMVIPQNDVARSPVVYALDPNTTNACTGRDWELGSHAPEGWVCLAGRAVDNAGNIGVSKPMRLCYDDPDTSFVPDCMMGSDPPDCTDGCTLPQAFPEDEGDAFIRQ